MLRIIFAKALLDQFDQIAGCPLPASTTPAIKSVPVLRDLSESADLDSLHGPSMMRT